jgi:hypothetical protein
MSKGEGRTIGYSVQYKREDGKLDPTGGKYLLPYGNRWTHFKYLMSRDLARETAGTWNEGGRPRPNNAVVVRHFVRPRAEKREWGVWFTSKLGEMGIWGSGLRSTRAEAERYVAAYPKDSAWIATVLPRPL